MTREWHDASSYLILLSVTDEAEVRSWSHKFMEEGIPFQQFNEPDLGGEATAVACGPLSVEQGQRLFSSLPLQGKELSMT